MPAGQQAHQGSGATPAALSLKKLDETIDLVKPGKPGGTLSGALVLVACDLDNRK